MSKRNKGLKWLGITIIGLLLVLCTFFFILLSGGFGNIPSKEELAQIKNETSSLVYSSDGTLIGQFFEINRTNIAFDSIPTHLIHALVATEDARFYKHKGIDARATFRVLFKSIIMQDEKAGGGSTLSQQLAKNLFGRNKYGTLSLPINKFKEIILANRLESIYTKDEILAFYLNTVPFGENTYGIEAAAKRYFSTSASQLNIQQSAILIGLLKANTRYNPRINPQNSLERRNVVLLQMKTHGYLTDSELDSISTLPLQLNYSRETEVYASNYYLKQVESELAVILKQLNILEDYKKRGLKITTTLNVTLQEAGKKAIRQQLTKMQELLNSQYEKGNSKLQIGKLADKIAAKKGIAINDSPKKHRNLFSWQKHQNKLTVKDSIIHVLKQLHSGLIGIHPQTGAVTCYLGGIDFNHYPFDQVKAKRQMASTFKPILYTQALRSGKTPCDYLSNDLVTLNDYEDWTPQNYDGKSGGRYSLAAALAKSKNLPTVHLYFETQQTALEQLWKALGFEEAINKGPSVILGTNSVSLKELAIAYAAFANGGKKVEPYVIESIRDENNKVIYQHKSSAQKSIFEPYVAQQMNEILFKAIREGTGSAIRSKYKIELPLAGKTGTSQNYADAWFITYNSELVLASRVGASYPSVHFKNANGSGGKLALPIVALTLQEALNNEQFRSIMSTAQLNRSSEIDCQDFKEADIIDGLFNIFKKKETDLNNERKRAKRKRKVKKAVRSIFGGSK